jgi:hypothetical protein
MAVNVLEESRGPVSSFGDLGPSGIAVTVLSRGWWGDSTQLVRLLIDSEPMTTVDKASVSPERA